MERPTMVAIFSRGGTLTHEEFCLKLDKIIQDVYGN